MVNYPNLLDNIFTLPTIAGTSETAIAVNALRESTLSIEKELGINPRGVYSDTRTRLDILESRINGSTDGYFIPDGYVNSPLYIVNSFYPLTVSITTGDGYPTENRLDGSLYLRRDGYVDEGLYSRRGGVWKQITTDPFVASGDLSGTYLTQTVVGLYNKPLNSTMASVGVVEDGYRLTWNNGIGKWEAQIGFFASKDLSGTKISQTVVGIQGNAVSSIIPLDGYALMWNSADNHWKPQSFSVIFAGSSIISDGYATRTNLTSNRIFQSPTLQTAGKVGMVNFGSGTSGGTSNDYAAILSGNENSASGIYSLIVGGDDNIAYGQYSAILDGYSNTVSADFALILGGNNNIGSGQNSFIGNGTNVTADGIYSSVLNGDTNFISGNHSVILDGYQNTILGSVSLIGDGYNNIIGGNYSTILNGASNIIDSTSSNNSVLNGAGNTLNTTNFAIVAGNTNQLTNVTNSLVIGSDNISESTFTTINGNSNTLGSSTTLNNIFGSSNKLINATNNNNIVGSSNTIDGYSGGVIFGFSNIINANLGTVSGQFGKSRMFGQEVKSNSRFTAGNIGEAQVSRIVLSGSSVSGGAILLQLQDVAAYIVTDATNAIPIEITTSSPHGLSTGHTVNISEVSGNDAANGTFVITYTGTNTFTLNSSVGSGVYTGGGTIVVNPNPFFMDGYSYEMNIRVLIVNTDPINPNPVVPARFIFDVLAHQEGNVLIFDNINQTLITPQASGLPWTVTVTNGPNADTSVAPGPLPDNQLIVQVDEETGPTFVQPTDTPSSRRAIATIEWREITRN